MRPRARLKTRIKKLEAAVGKGARNCPRCRLAAMHSQPDKTHLKPEDILKARCEFCSSEYTVSLENYAPDEREIVRLHHSVTCEGYFTNPKVYAFIFWSFLKNPPKIELMQLLEEKAKKDPDARLYIKLSIEVAKLCERKHERLKLKYGDFPFPGLLRSIQSIRTRGSRSKEAGVFVPQLSELEEEETKYLIFAELEKVIWGEPRSDTSIMLDGMRRLISKVIDTAVQEKQKLEDMIRPKTKETPRADVTETSEKDVPQKSVYDVEKARKRRAECMEKLDRKRRKREMLGLR